MVGRNEFRRYGFIDVNLTDNSGFEWREGGGSISWGQRLGTMFSRGVTHIPIGGTPGELFAGRTFPSRSPIYCGTIFHGVVAPTPNRNLEGYWQ